MDENVCKYWRVKRISCHNAQIRKKAAVLRLLMFGYRFDRCNKIPPAISAQIQTAIPTPNANQLVPTIRMPVAPSAPPITLGIRRRLMQQSGRKKQKENDSGKSQKDHNNRNSPDSAASTSNRSARQVLISSSFFAIICSVSSSFPPGLFRPKNAETGTSKACAI